jgi:hypothetical protein
MDKHKLITRKYHYSSLFYLSKISISLWTCHLIKSKIGKIWPIKYYIFHITIYPLPRMICQDTFSLYVNFAFKANFVFSVLLRNYNCLCFNLKGRLTSVGAIWIRGMLTLSPSLHYDGISAPMK